MYIHTEISSLRAHQISLSGGVDKSLLAHNPAHSTIHVDAERRAQLLAHVFCPDGPLCAHMKRVSSRAIRTAVIAYFMCGARPECSRSECTRARSYLRLREYALHLVCCARIYLSASYDLYIYLMFAAYEEGVQQREVVATCCSAVQYIHLRTFHVRNRLRDIMRQRRT